MTCLESALRLAALGYRVFPLEPNGKKPVIKGWPDLATTDEGAVRRWWTDWPDANIGVATGKGLLVIDADCKVKGGVRERGLESLAMLDMLGLPQGFRVRTATGGVHVYLRCADDVGLTVAAEPLEEFPGIDYRCDGGYVVGPGSIVDGAPYLAV